MIVILRRHHPAQSRWPYWPYTALTESKPYLIPGKCNVCVLERKKEKHQAIGTTITFLQSPCARRTKIELESYRSASIAFEVLLPHRDNSLHLFFTLPLPHSHPVSADYRGREEGKHQPRRWWLPASASIIRDKRHAV